MTTKVDVSRFCEECLKFRRKKCEGIAPLQKTIPYFGGRRCGQRFRAGLHFCRSYEFDERLYHFQDGSGEVETIKHVRQRQAKRDVENSNQEAFNDFTLGANLSSSDFADLI